MIFSNRIVLTVTLTFVINCCSALINEPPVARTASAAPAAPAATSADGTNRPMIYIDMLRERYLSLEKAMWLIIRSGAERSFVLDRIHQTHKTFFNEPWNGKECDLLDDDPEQKQLLQSFAHIQRICDTIQQYYANGNLKEEWFVEFAGRGQFMNVAMERIYNVTIDRHFFQYIRNKGELQTCNQPLREIKSTSQMLYDYYTDIAIYQLKAYVITQLSYMLLTEYGKQNLVNSGINLRDQFIQRSRQTQNTIGDIMNDVSRTIYMCDPDEFMLGDNYDMVTRLLQGYIDNEVNLNPINDCKRSCRNYELTKNYQCFNGSFCDGYPELRCKGDIVNCEYVGSHLSVCPSSKDSDRRYDAIAYDRGIYYGMDMNECTTGSQRAVSWTRWFVQCTNCFCYCDEPGPKSDRYFSLRPVYSNTAQNMVITGVGLIKIDRIFTWKITEGQLLGNGEINKTTVHLKTGHIFKLDDTGVESGIDYYTLNWKNRSVSLDTIIAPVGKVLTGLRFAQINGHLALEIKASMFDFNTGRVVDLGELDWQRNLNKSHTKLDIPESGYPTGFPSKSVPDIQFDKYVEFGPTSREMDVAQTTVPFVDTQFVQQINAAPLAGIGLYYKGQPHSGGFIAPKLITYNYQPYFQN